MHARPDALFFKHGSRVNARFYYPEPGINYVVVNLLIVWLSATFAPHELTTTFKSPCIGCGDKRAPQVTLDNIEAAAYKRRKT